MVTQQTPTINTPPPREAGSRPVEWLGYQCRKHQPIRDGLNEARARYHVRFGLVANLVQVNPAQLADLGDVPGMTVEGARNVAPNTLHVGRSAVGA